MDRWEVSEEKAMKEIIRWMSKNDDSVCFVGIVNNIPIAIGVFDVQSNADKSLGPWNRQLYIEPAYRGENYGLELTQQRFIWAKEKGYKEVYLSTETVKRYHMKHGWQIVREEIKPDKIITIMRYDLKNI
ncbi:MAG: N-acetyltransferase GCN5 [Candidatus Nomurabacteria bacterium GW2011_GWB1_37_5]|uniref:N-acetyltransferase GCN5 n=1 Tax=Candidatus Nomurabacteria bacterium GW2011_GWB1_37_5 TaxID=1618742 RepID=A0A0G0GYF9_9BACT|nr:MAG: N-acetyltransferase GCN5 [Candidatus Nomurabacteria bacterium GW2011_GWB1_37_5]